MNMTFRIACAAVLLSATALPVVAQPLPGLSSLLQSQQGRIAFSQLIAGQHLPGWIKKGGVETPMQEVTLDGTTYQLYYSCKPHDCAADRFALIYSPADNSMSGLWSRVDEKNHKEQLRWLNISDKFSVDGKTVLYAAISGSLANHPHDFNYTSQH
ncbi:Ivy family c-type lysozyme inhibitor [Tatumella citrea]|nr:Ivy family c-type lysozyme inhibitor [Tatumella citrea]